MSDPNAYPPGWNQDKVQRVIDYYENLTDEEAAVEFDSPETPGTVTMVAVPTELLPAVRALLAALR